MAVTYHSILYLCSKARNQGDTQKDRSAHLLVSTTDSTVVYRVALWTGPVHGPQFDENTSCKRFSPHTHCNQYVTTVRDHITNIPLACGRSRRETLFSQQLNCTSPSIRLWSGEPDDQVKLLSVKLGVVPWIRKVVSVFTSKLSECFTNSGYFSAPKCCVIELLM